MAAGTSNMNDLTVIQATQGLARYAIETIQDAQTRGVVVGRDHRAVEGLSSERFASLTAGVFRREGFKVYEYDGLVHTPMVVRCLRERGLGAEGQTNRVTRTAIRDFPTEGCTWSDDYGEPQP